MDFARIKRFDMFEVHHDPECTAVLETLGNFYSETTTFFRSTGDSQAVGVRLKSTQVNPGGLWNIEISVPTQSLVYSDINLPNGKLKFELFGEWNASEYDFYMNDAEVLAYVDSVLVATWSMGDLVELGTLKAPSTLPLVAIPCKLQTWTDGILPLRPDEYHDTMIGSLNGGWRWIVDGDPEQFPVTLRPGEPPGCSINAPYVAQITGNDTWDMTVEAGVTVDADGATVVAKSYNSYVYCIPDLDKPIKKIGDDYRAGYKRKATPAVYLWERSHCTHEIVGGGTFYENEDVPVEVFPEFSEAKNVVGQFPHAIEEPFYIPSYALYQRMGNYLRREYTGVSLHDQYNRLDLVEMVGAESAPSGCYEYLDSDSAVTRYWDFNVHPDKSFKLNMNDWYRQGGDLEVPSYWRPIRQQVHDDPDYPVEENTTTFNLIVLDAINSCLLWHDLIRPEPERELQLGACRWITIDTEPVTGVDYDDTSEPLWSVTGATLDFQPTEIVLTPD